MSALNTINAILCFWIAYVAFALMAHRHPPKTVQDKILQVGLGIIFGLSIAAALLPFPTGKSPASWTVGIRIGGALVATVAYDETFNIRNQLGELRLWLRLLADRWGLGR